MVTLDWYSIDVPVFLLRRCFDRSHHHDYEEWRRRNRRSYHRHKLSLPKSENLTTNQSDRKEGNAKMVATITCPATRALELQQHKMDISKVSRQASIDSKLSHGLFSLNFENSYNAFPVIEWDSNEDSDSLSDSSSVRSMESWNSVLIDSDSSLGKRGRSKPKNTYRRLVRSKKIKSDLSSLAKNFPTRS